MTLVIACASIGAWADEPAADPARLPAYHARFDRARPLIAVVGLNAGTEVTDFVVPYGILTHAGVADVMALATGPGPIKMRPALVIEPHATIEQFDQRFAQGADYVIVPAVAMGRHNDPVLLGWLQDQAAKGATIVSVCDGALVVAEAGLFRGRRATGHWATQARREHDYPDTRWLKNTRYVADGNVISTAGVSAAIPLSLALVESIGGQQRAERVAQELGVDAWGPQHDSEPFHLGLRHYLAAAGNMLFSPREDIGLPVADGVDDIALALAIDAFGRTHRSPVYALAASAGAVRTRYGLALRPDRVAGDGAAPLRVVEGVAQTAS
ncbi:MAG TPA: DJ-1/PfpI family protein, partial [Burkholderiaceae bacterium]|nr:DJ-1/PfpI family protein [Burkholderiaceae bacterium]